MVTRGWLRRQARCVAIGVGLASSLAVACAAVAQSGVDVSVPEENRIVPHVRVGKVTIGMTRLEVTKILGKPLHTARAAYGYSHDLYFSRGSGELLLVDYQAEKVVQIEFTSPTFRTDKGLGTSVVPSKRYQENPVEGGGLSFAMLRRVSSDDSDEIVYGKVFAGPTPPLKDCCLEGELWGTSVDRPQWDEAVAIPEKDLTFALVPVYSRTLVDSFRNRKGVPAGYQVFRQGDKVHPLLKTDTDLSRDIGAPVLEDFNRDGYIDFMVQATQGVRGGYNTWTLYLYDLAKKTFVETVFGSNPKFDAKTGILTFTTCCQDSTTTTYQARGGKLVEISRQTE